MRKRIVIIIGAGASNALHPQFALGSGLLQQISDRVTDRTIPDAPYLSKILEDHGFSELIRSEFVKQLDKYKASSSYPSIDGFLDEVTSYPEYSSVRDQFLQIGKFAIMFQILGYEAEIRDPVSGGLKTDSWLNELAVFINENKLYLSGEYDNDIKLITFNYDRTIEHFLYNHSLFENEQNEIYRFLENSLIHVYGKIGPLD